MNLQRVKRNAHQGALIPCCNCNTMRREVECYADLDGVPFKSYYCQECAEAINPNQVDGVVVYAVEHQICRGY